MVGTRPTRAPREPAARDAFRVSSIVRRTFIFQKLRMK
jgi:hypothetical protein